MQKCECMPQDTWHQDDKHLLPDNSQMMTNTIRLTIHSYRQTSNTWHLTYRATRMSYFSWKLYFSCSMGWEVWWIGKKIIFLIFLKLNFSPLVHSPLFCKICCLNNKMPRNETKNKIQSGRLIIFSFVFSLIFEHQKKFPHTSILNLNQFSSNFPPQRRRKI